MTGSPLVLAHLGHWYVQLAFAIPSLLLVGAVTRDSRRRQRRREREQRAADVTRERRDG